MSGPGADPDIDRAVRRQVGIAALRRLRRMVDAEVEQAVEASRWARRLAWGLAILALLAVIALLAVR